MGKYHVDALYMHYLSMKLSCLYFHFADYLFIRIGGEGTHHILVLNAVIILYMKCLHVTIAKAHLLFLVLLLPY
jgi:hypothetical protein